ncbi:MAG: PAS domain S-box protein, partial [Anaerolineae bacterium]|nr:PAS domain S-box protein [Anaerolineae bacterium]
AIHDSDGNVLSYEGSVIDITQRKQVEALQQKTELILSGILDTALDGIINLDKNLNILLFNHGAEYIFGYRANEVIGKPLNILIPERFHQSHTHQVSEFSASPVVSRHMNERMPLTGLRKNGVEFLAEISIAKLVVAGETTFTATIHDITERQQTENALRQSETNFRNLLDEMPDSVSVQIDQKVVYCNPAFSSLLAIPAEEIVGNPILDYIHPDDHAYCQGYFQKDNQFPTEFKLINTQDHTIPVEVTTRGIEYNGQPAKLCVFHDLTSRKHAEAALRENEEKYRALFQESREATFIFDLDGQIIECNQAFVELFNYPYEEVLTLNVDQFYFRSQDRSRIEKAIQDQPFIRDFEMSLLKKNGDQFDSTITMARIKAEGKTIGFHGIVRDITRRKQSEREMETIVAANAALRKAANRDEALQIILDQFTSLLSADGVALVLRSPTSHELRIEVAAGIWENWPINHVMPDEGITGYVLTQSKPYLNNDISGDLLIKKIGLLQGVLAAACIPLIAQEIPIGVIWLGRNAEISPETLRLITILATIAANTIHRFNLYDNIARALQESQAIAEIGQKLNQSLDMGKIFQEIVDAAINIIPLVNRAIIHLYDENEERLHAVALSRSDQLDLNINFPIIRVLPNGNFDFSRLADQDLQASSMSQGKGIAGRAIEQKELLSSNNIQNDPRFLETGNASPDIRAMIVAPILNGDKRLGTISVISDKPNVFSPTDGSLLERLSIQATTAIENARKYEAEHIQRELAEAQAEVSAVLNQTLELDQVLDHILKQTIRVGACTGADVTLFEGEKTYMAGHYSVSQATLMTTYYQDVLANPLLPEIPTMSEMIATGRPIVVKNTKTDPRWIETPMSSWIKSYAGIPLLAAGNLIGFLNLNSDQEDFFTPETVQQLEAFANDAAIAVHNAHLYKKLETALLLEQTARTQLLMTDKLAGMGRMVASVAHELNNPLQTIKNCLFLMEQNANQGADRELFEMSLSEVERLSAIVARLREVYRPRQSDKFKPISVQSLLSEVQNLVEVHMRRSKIIWDQAPFSEDYIISGNLDGLKQVFINLSLNASEAMQPEGGKLHITVSPSTDDKQIGISFIDSGPGLSEEYIQYAFDPFFTTKESGMGLGLSICYDIVQNHNGQIVVESPPGQGAVFTVWLPVLKTSLPSIPHRRAPA